MDDVDAAFAGFVADRRPTLLGTALLLTGDRRSAEELVQRSLTRARRRARDPETAVLRALVAGSTGRWTRLARADQVIESLPDPFARPDPFAPTGPDLAGPDLATALRELPPRVRAVVVLRWHEHLPDDRVAALVRAPVGTVRAEAARGLRTLEPSVAPSGYERAAADVPAEQRLSGELARLASAPGPWRLDPPASLADLRVRRRRSRQRVAGAVAALCVLGLAVPLTQRTPGTAPPAPAAATTIAPAGITPPPIAPRPRPVLTGPTRGSLAGDAAFLADVRAVGWGAQEAPPADQREVVLATDTPNGRVVLVVGTVLEDFRGVWLTGPVGAAAADLVPHLPRQLGRDRPLSLLIGGPGDASLVVVAAPDDQVDVSDRLMTGPRGTVGREYTPLPADDGVAVAPARTTTLGPALSVRVSREGREVYRSAVDWTGDRPHPAPPPALAPLRPGGSAPDGSVVHAALTDLAIPLGVEPPALQPLLLWSAALPGSGSVAVLVAHSPGGALVVTTWAGERGTVVSCGTQTPPGSTPVATLNVARVCDGRWLVVTTPGDAAGAELLDARGRSLGPLALDGGNAVVPLPDGARSVRMLDADGQPLRETPIAPSPTEPFGDFGSGPAR